MNKDEIIVALRASLSVPQRGYYWREVVMNAIECIERQIPTKPIERADSYYYCKCGEVLSAGYYQATYCHACGRKLDWSDVK